MLSTSAAFLALAALSPVSATVSDLRCAESLSFPTLDQPLQYSQSNDLFSYKLAYDASACAGSDISLILTGSTPDDVSSCALESSSDARDARIFYPPRQSAHSFAADMTLFCATPQSHLKPGQDYQLQVYVGEHSVIRKPFSIRSDLDSRDFDGASSSSSESSPAFTRDPSPWLSPIALHCDQGYMSCPISRDGNGILYHWACLPANELTSCGGCPNILSGNEESGLSGQDCTDIAGALGTLCVERKCVATSCLDGYDLSDDVCTPRREHGALAPAEELAFDEQEEEVVVAKTLKQLFPGGLAGRIRFQAE